MKEVLRKYADEEEVDENTCIPDRKARKRKCEQRWTEEVQSKKTLDLYAAVKKWLNEEKYVNDPGDRRANQYKTVAVMVSYNSEGPGSSLSSEPDQ